MNVQGPAAAVFRPLVTGTGGRATPAGAPAPQAAPAPAAARPGAPSEKALWDVLTDEERAFFAQQAQLGSITYRSARSAAPSPAGPIGQRIDVRG